MTRRPNVILVITDDQGYGDLGCTGNPLLKTPHIDRFYSDSVRSADFHVCPLCTPTRGSIMTGRRPLRNGAWATAWGRSILRKDETTLAQLFANAGYRTGMFGKWHLGDTFPYRPQDRGFETVVAHKGGGVGQTPDVWGNKYFDDTYFHNGKSVAHEGYCTDIWFNEALAFVEQHRREPFFAYLATNAPHSPYLVADKYKAPYEGDPSIPHAGFYGMIANIDENFGRLRTRLAKLGLEDDTILIFMTDNGSGGGCTAHDDERIAHGYNSGMRGTKGSYYDGGHRVPFFIRWPAGAIGGGRDVTEMCLDVDIMPTFAGLCGLDLPRNTKLDGLDISPLLCGETASFPGDRMHFLQYRQDTKPPEKWENAVISRRWRLVRGKELYDIKTDPGQSTDIAMKHPDVVSRMRQAHEEWWKEAGPALAEYCPHVLGDDAENPVRLDAMDVMGDIAWQQPSIAQACRTSGTWTVEIARPGRYRFSLRRWPEELRLSIGATISAEDISRLAYGKPNSRRGAFLPSHAQIGICGFEQKQPVDKNAVSADFELTLEQTGTTQLDAWFIMADGQRWGAYYVYVERV